MLRQKRMMIMNKARVKAPRAQKTLLTALLLVEIKRLGKQGVTRVKVPQAKPKKASQVIHVRHLAEEPIRQE